MYNSHATNMSKKKNIEYLGFELLLSFVIKLLYPVHADDPTIFLPFHGS